MFVFNFGFLEILSNIFFRLCSYFSFISLDNVFGERRDLFVLP